MFATTLLAIAAAVLIVGALFAWDQWKQRRAKHAH